MVLVNLSHQLQSIFRTLNIIILLNKVTLKNKFAVKINKNEMQYTMYISRLYMHKFQSIYYNKCNKYLKCDHCFTYEK